MLIFELKEECLGNIFNYFRIYWAFADSEHTVIYLRYSADTSLDRQMPPYVQYLGDIPIVTRVLG